MLIRIKQSELSCTSEVNFSSRIALQIWHERLGHQGKRHVKTLLKEGGMGFLEDDNFCGACVEGKQCPNSYYEC